MARELEEIPGKIEAIVDAQRGGAADRRAVRSRTTTSSTSGRGYNFPVALEGALKLKEISYIHAEGYPAAEMKHGPIALIDENMPVVFICTRDARLRQGDEQHDGGAGAQRQHHRDRHRGRHRGRSRSADHVLYVPPHACHASQPLLSVIPLQLLAYHAAVLRGCDVDQPRNLAKSVTVGVT